MCKNQNQPETDIKVLQAKRAFTTHSKHIDELGVILDSDTPGLLRFIASRLIDIQLLLDIEK